MKYGNFMQFHWDNSDYKRQNVGVSMGILFSDEAIEIVTGEYEKIWLSYSEMG